MADYSELALIRSLNYLAETQASIANNLANVDSLGYKRRTAHAVESGEKFRSLLDVDLPLADYAERSDFTAGAMRRTGDSFHSAIAGNGFFMVRDAGENRYYTRKGEMMIDSSGRLITPSGEAFLSDDGLPIELRTEDGAAARNILISPDGTIQSDTGERVGKLGVFRVNDPHQLIPAGNSRFADLQDAPPERDATSKIRHKHLERSNVDSLAELVNMISVQRSFQAATRALNSIKRAKAQFISSLNR